MSLFGKTENKYYEVLAELLNDGKAYSREEVNRILEERIVGEVDFEVKEALFPGNEGQTSVLQYEDGGFYPLIEASVPIRCNAIELQAAKCLPESEYIKHFLPPETVEKLKTAMGQVPKEWSLRDITIKNQFAGGVTQTEGQFEQKLGILSQAIRSHTAVLYDNVVEGKFAYYNEIVYPVKLEYSFSNDRYWLSGYSPKEKRYYKMNLSTVSNIRSTDQVFDEVQEGYRDFLLKNRRTAVLEVVPIPHVLDRCFRIFSYYDREAVYDEEEQKCRLEIHYLRQEEKELIRDILSLGKWAVVLEPEELQQTVYHRILAAAGRYEDV